MKYIIESKSSQITKKYIDTLKEKNNISDDNLFVFDYEEKNNLQHAYNQYMSSDFFNSKKMIILKSFDLINEENISKNIKAIMDELCTANSDNLIIFTISKIKKTKSQWKKYNEHLEHLQQEPPKKEELSEFVINYFNKYQISYDKSSINLLLNNINENFDILISELSKLKLLDRHINKDLIEDVIYDHKSDTVFELIESLFSETSKPTESIINKLLKNGMTAITILQFLISDLTLITQLRIHSKLNNYFNIYDISNKYNINSYRLKKASEKAKKWKTERLLSFLENLVSLELKLMKNSPENQEFIIIKTLLSSKI